MQNAQNRNRKILSLLLCMVLIVAMALCTTGCNGKDGGSTSSPGTDTQQDGSASWLEGGSLGEGNTQFAFTVVDKDGREAQFEIHTDKETVGEALLELGLIAGEDGEFGLYVKTVNGVTADYDKDGVYWALYINDAYAQTGVDSTPIAEGESYSFKAE